MSFEIFFLNGNFLKNGRKYDYAVMQIHTLISYRPYKKENDKFSNKKINYLTGRITSDWSDYF